MPITGVSHKCMKKNELMFVSDYLTKLIPTKTSRRIVYFIMSYKSLTAWPRSNWLGESPNRCRYLRKRSASLGFFFFSREAWNKCRPASDSVRDF